MKRVILQSQKKWLEHLRYDGLWPPKVKDLIVSDVELMLDLRLRTLWSWSTPGIKSSIIPVNSLFIYLGPFASVLNDMKLSDNEKLIITKAKATKSFTQILWYDSPVYVSRTELWTWFRFASRPENEE